MVNSICGMLVLGEKIGSVEKPVSFKQKEVYELGPKVCAHRTFEDFGTYNSINDIIVVLLESLHRLRGSRWPAT